MLFGVLGGGWRVAFYALALLNPYVEWTGYVANVGFALAEIFRSRREGLPRAFGRAAGLAGLTLCSLVLFCAHYLMRVSAADFLDSLLFSFTARNAVSDQATYLDLLSGYVGSLLFLWGLLGVALAWALLARRGSLSFSPGFGALLFVSAFPLLENVVMKQHAVAYGYDRMKAAVPLVLILCELARNALEARPYRRAKGALATAALVAAALVTSSLNFASYVNDEHYIYSFCYKEDNELIARAINERYPDAVYACNRGIRGYANLLFGRGIYEFQTLESARALAGERGADTVVYITMDPPVVLSVEVISPESPGGVTYTVEDGEVVEAQGIFAVADDSGL